MNMLATLTTDENIENEKDVVGGGFQPLEAGLYKASISLAYLKKSTGGAMGLVLHATTESGQEIRQTIYMTSGDAKGNKNYYTDKQGNKAYLPGFNLVNSLCLLTVGKEISQLATEDKVVSLYSYDAKAEIPTTVPMLMDLLGQEVLLGVQKQIVDKRQKGDDGQYHATGETREENEIDKAFRARDGMTTAEIRAKAEDASFVKTWEQKWSGVTRDKSTGVAGNAGAPKASGKAIPGAISASKPTQSLFA